MTTGSAPGPGAGASPGVLLPRSFYRGSSTELAPRLLNKVLVCGDRAVRIVEVEAYGGADDPASHAFRGQTPRNATMFGRPGLLYVYFSYGMHWCANVVCGEEGQALAVLLRAGAPLRGIDAMWASRPAARRERDLASGPAKLCQALDIDRRHDGVDLAGPGSAVAILDDGTPPPRHPGRSRRVGISVAVDRPWRWYVPDDPNVSRTRARP